MIIKIPDDNSIIKWKKNDKDEWKYAETSDLIKAYEERLKSDTECMDEDAKQASIPYTYNAPQHDWKCGYPDITKSNYYNRRGKEDCPDSCPARFLKNIVKDCPSDIERSQSGEYTRGFIDALDKAFLKFDANCNYSGNSVLSKLEKLKEEAN